MGEMGIDLGRTQQIASEIDSYGKDLRNYSERIEQVSQRLRKNHGISISALCGKIDLQNEEILGEAAKLEKLSSSLNSIVVKYTETEEKIAGYKPGTSIVESILDIGEVKFDPMLGPGSVLTFPDLTNLEEKLEKLKKILKPFDKFGEIAEAGVGEKTIAYIESLIAFLKGDKKEITGASDWFDLTDSSINVWTKLYDYYKDIYGEMQTGIFSDVVQKKVKILGVAAGFSALISSVFSASDGLGNKKMPNIIADYVDCGKDVLSIIKADYALKHIGDTKSLAKIKAGPWSAMDVYTAIGKSGVKAVSQGFRSYEKYSSDGDWTAGDTGATGVDVAISGIYSLTNELTYGVADVIYGTVDRLTGGNGTVDMSYAEKSMEGYKIIAEETGKAIGKLIKKIRK